jgi:hypothetical protein
MKLKIIYTRFEFKDEHNGNIYTVLFYTPEKETKKVRVINCGVNMCIFDAPHFNANISTATDFLKRAIAREKEERHES